MRQIDWGLMERSDMKPWFELENNMNVYERFVKVRPFDIVMDVGASIGFFPAHIIDKNPRRVYCLEPSKPLFETLLQNFPNQNNMIFSNVGIGPKDEIDVHPMVFFNDTVATSFLKFQTYLDIYNIKKIDFMKLDCEGGEYDIFTDENFPYLVNNVHFITGEWHLSREDTKEKFRYFANNYLNKFKHVEIVDVTGQYNITKSLWDDQDGFIKYYTEVIIYIFCKEDLK